MIETLKEIVINLVTLVIVMVILEILMPGGNFKKLIKLVSGFVLIIAIMNPVLEMFGKSLDLNDYLIQDSNLMDKKVLLQEKTILNQVQMEQITKNYKKKLADQIEKDIKNMSMSGRIKAEVIVNEDFNSEGYGEIEKARLEIISDEKENEIQPAIKIEKIEFDTRTKNRKEYEEKNETEEKGEEIIFEDESKIKLKHEIQKRINTLVGLSEENVTVVFIE